MGIDKDVLTTGDVARICGVTIRTVIKWYDHGRLEGFRLPGSRDRRFTVEAMTRFLRDNGMPLTLLDRRNDRTRRLLVVDDDVAVCELISRFLGDLDDLEVSTAHSGWEAGLKTASLRPHLLLLDYRLGDMTADQVVDTIRGFDELAQPAIIIMSAHLTEADAAEVLAHGADAFLPKPFDLEDLRDKVLHHVGIRS
jgi:CheY-like chemotaxis protein